MYAPTPVAPVSALQLVEIDKHAPSAAATLANFEQCRRKTRRVCTTAALPHTVVVCCDGGFIQVVDVASGSFGLFRLHLGPHHPIEVAPRCACIDPNPSVRGAPGVALLLAPPYAPTLVRASSATGEVLDVHVFNSRPSAVDADGDLVAAADGCGAMGVWSAGVYEQHWVRQVPGAAAGVATLRVHRDVIIAGLNDFAVLVVAAHDGAVVTSLVGECALAAVLPTPPFGDAIVTATTRGVLNVWAPPVSHSRRPVVAPAGAAAGAAQTAALALSPNGVACSVLAQPLAPGESWSLLHSVATDLPVGAAALHNGFLAIGATDGRVVLFDATRLASRPSELELARIRASASAAAAGGGHAGGHGKADLPLLVSFDLEDAPVYADTHNDNHVVVVTAVGDVWRWGLQEVLAKYRPPATAGATPARLGVDDAAATPSSSRRPYRSGADDQQQQHRVARGLAQELTASGHRGPAHPLQASSTLSPPRQPFASRPAPAADAMSGMEVSGSTDAAVSPGRDRSSEARQQADAATDVSTSVSHARSGSSAANTSSNQGSEAEAEMEQRTAAVPTPLPPPWSGDDEGPFGADARGDGTTTDADANAASGSANHFAMPPPDALRVRRPTVTPGGFTFPSPFVNFGNDDAARIQGDAIQDASVSPMAPHEDEQATVVVVGDSDDDHDGSHEASGGRAAAGRAGNVEASPGDRVASSHTGARGRASDAASDVTGTRVSFAPPSTIHANGLGDLSGRAADGGRQHVSSMPSSVGFAPSESDLDFSAHPSHFARRRDGSAFPSAAHHPRGAAGTSTRREASQTSSIATHQHIDVPASPLKHAGLTASGAIAVPGLRGGRRVDPEVLISDLAQPARGPSSHPLATMQPHTSDILRARIPSAAATTSRHHVLPWHGGESLASATAMMAVPAVQHSDSPPAAPLPVAPLLTTSHEGDGEEVDELAVRDTTPEGYVVRQDQVPLLHQHDATAEDGARVDGAVAAPIIERHQHADGRIRSSMVPTTPNTIGTSRHTAPLKEAREAADEHDGTTHYHLEADHPADGASPTDGRPLVTFRAIEREDGFDPAAYARERKTLLVALEHKHAIRGQRYGRDDVAFTDMALRPAMGTMVLRPTSSGSAAPSSSSHVDGSSMRLYGRSSSRGAAAGGASSPSEKDELRPVTHGLRLQRRVDDAYERQKRVPAPQLMDDFVAGLLMQGASSVAPSTVLFEYATPDYVAPRPMLLPLPMPPTPLAM